MFKLLNKEYLSESVVKAEIEAPAVSAKIGPGQFVIIRSHENGERIPLTVADFDREKGTITIIFQTVGASTKLLATLEAGEYILDVVGPLGNKTELDGATKVAVIGGGLGCAIAYPQAKYLHNSGAKVDIIAGFRSKDLIILEDDMKKVSDSLTILTDEACSVDSKYNMQILHTNVLKNLIICSLQEGGIQCHNWDHTLLGKASGHRNRMLFRYAYIKKSFRMDFFKLQ